MSLSLDQALALSRQNAPTLQAARARVEAATARLQGARARPNPTLALALPFAISGGRGTTGGFDEGVFASQTIEGPGKRGFRSQIAQNELVGANFDLAGSGTSLTFSVKSTYFDTLRARSERDLAREALANARRFALAATEQEAAGDVPRRDVLRAQTEVARAQTSLDLSEADFQNRRATLASLVGLPDGTRLTLSDSLGFLAATVDPVALETFALAKRADVAGASALILARQAAIKSAQAARRPDAFVEARAATFPGTTGAQGASLRIGVTVPIFDFGSIKAGVNEARAGLREQTALVAEARRIAVLEVRSALTTLAATQKTVQDFQNGRLERARELLDMVQTGYSEGASSLLDVLDARAVYRAEQTDYLRALAAYNTALADLERSLGGALPTNTGATSGTNAANSRGTNTPNGAANGAGASNTNKQSATQPTTTGANPNGAVTNGAGNPGNVGNPKGAAATGAAATGAAGTGAAGTGAAATGATGTGASGAAAR